MPSSPEPGGRPATSSRLPQPRASVIGAVLEGWRRVLRAPLLTLGVLLLTLLTAAPLAYVMRDAIETQLGASLESERALQGWDREWVSDFTNQAQGLAKTFTHEILGFGGTLAAMSRLIDATALPPSLLGVVAVYVAIWIFLSGGILDRVARGRAVRTSAFFAACGVYFFRFLRVGVLIGSGYWALFYWLHPFLFTTLYNRWTTDLAVEAPGIAIRAALYAVFLVALMIVSLIADFAKVRMVVEDRRSAISAIGASTRFIRRRAGRVIGLYGLNALVFLVLARLWMQTAPSATASDWLALLGGQLFVLARIWAKLAFMASEVAFFQGELAHANFTAAPEPGWPDSPAVEAIANLRT